VRSLETSETTIRPAILSDLPAVQRVLVETWHATYDNIYGRQVVDRIVEEWHALSALRAQLDNPRALSEHT